MSRSLRYCYNEVAPFSALVIVQFTEVGVNILFKEATNKGLSYYVFIFYSFAISTLILLIPLPFIYLRSIGLPSFNFSLLCKVFSLGFLVFSAQLCGYKGIEYSSPSLASAVSNLLPAFIFILAVFFRMEKVNLRSSSTQSKIMGSVTSIAGALVVIFYKGPTILNAASPSQPPSLDSLLVSSQRNWILGGSLLAVAYILMSIWYILLAFFSTIISTIIQTWSLHMKGPVYVSIFKPLSIAIAAAMSVIFLGESLYLGSVVGAVILCIGFYAVIWGKSKEELIEDDENLTLSNLRFQSNSMDPLLQR
ncbi:PREDICTED: WAT1-related protein At5g40240-like isoform X3 [Lupinus angustifolius]|uniref:WAT1-related protein At5g40240-like isoform X3 n=1 Tax=Lupinus angustifolius TaxID=3871 RepID=UPI00092EB2E4|nr:PREDICTED: WAT1-related protein At5g40240-like isoform X3 [Lupinus angustifolius]